MSRHRPLRLARLALALPMIVPAAAQGATTDTAPRREGVHRPKPREANAPETISIVGRGSTRQSQSLSQARFAAAAPGTNPLRVLGQLPGVSYNSSDPLGIDVYSANVYMHGFTQDQLGFTLDGIPLGAQGYGASGEGYGSIGGINVNSAITSENIGRVNVSQGAGSVDVASASNLGGVMQFVSSDPADTYGGRISQAFGSEGMKRTYIRLDSGTLDPQGTKFYVSYARSEESVWKGSGEDFLQQVNAKAVQPLGLFGTMSVFFDWDSEDETTYADESNEILSKLGPRVDYYYPDYGAAYRAAEGIYPAGYDQLSDPLDASYYDGPSWAQNYFGGIKLNLDLTDHLRWDTTVYGHGKNFAGYYTSPYYPSPNGAPLSEEEFASYSKRLGFLSDLRADFGRHHVDAGVWYEYMNAYSPERLYEEPILGEGQPLDPLGNLGVAYAVPWAYIYNDDTFQAHLQDTWQVTDRLRVNAGFRSLFFTGRSKIAQNEPDYSGYDDLPSGAISADDAFLPQFSANWAFAKNQELFFDFSENMRTYPQSGLEQGSPWGVATEAAFSELQQDLKPEHDFVYELGYRYDSHLVSALLDLYHADFSNRLQAIAYGPLALDESTIANVGSVEMYGLDAGVIVRPLPGLELSNNLSLNSSKYQQNIASDGVTYDLRGKQEVNYPELMYKGNLSYTWRQVTAHIDTSYIGRRYFSYTDDESVPGYWLTNVGVNWRIPCGCRIKAFTVGFNVYNLTNSTYVSVTGETGNPLSGDYQTFQIGAPRTFYGSVGAEF